MKKNIITLITALLVAFSTVQVGQTDVVVPNAYGVTAGNSTFLGTKSDFWRQFRRNANPRSLRCFQESGLRHLHSVGRRTALAWISCLPTSLYSGGHLLFEFRHYGYTGTSHSVDSIGTAISGYGNQFSAVSNGSYTATSGSQGNFSVIQFSTSPVPVPGTLFGLAAIGPGSVLISRRRF